MRKFIMAAFVLLLTSSAYGAVPLSFTHHGVLKENGDPVNGQHTIKAVIYNEVGTVVGQNEEQKDITSGLYTLVIPNIDAALVTKANKLELAISVDGEALSPRLPINSVPYAIATEHAETASRVYLTGSYNYKKVGAPLEAAPDDANACSCDTNEETADCPTQGFDVSVNEGDQCYDKFGIYYIIFELSNAMATNAIALDNGKLGLGTSSPVAPLDILNNSGADNYEAIIADTVPEVLFEDLDGDNVSISVDDGTLKINGNIESANFKTNQVNATSIGPDLLNVLYPIGAIYISTTATNPGTTLGGTWEAFGKGKTLVGVDNNDDDFATVEKTGGEKTHTLSTNEMPSHDHSFTGTEGTVNVSGGDHRHQVVDDNKTKMEKVPSADGGNGGNWSGDGTGWGQWSYSRYSGELSMSGKFTPSGSIGSTGEGAAHNNLQPYITVYMWKRTK